ncbi:MAG: acylphosphatase [Ignavibacteriaceae bacterium]
MSEDQKRAEIIAKGLVQGVGFRYFILKNAGALGLKGFTKNLYSGEVQTVVEGSRGMIEELFNKIKVGPSHASVNDCKIFWDKFKDEFDSFEIKH